MKQGLNPPVVYGLYSFEHNPKASRLVGIAGDNRGGVNKC